MKYSESLLSLSVILIVILIITGCTREEEPEIPRKELITLALTGDISADSLEAYVTWMQGMGTRFALAENRRSIAVRLRKKFIQFGYADASLDSFEITKTYNNIEYQQYQYNVIATLEGNTNPDSICILGGHYDNILKSGTGDPFITAYGANDNASGVAAALEIARVMKKNDYSPRNTIKFIAYGAEEMGLLGSYDHSGKSKNNNDKIMMMLNNDMIAYEPNSNKANWFVNIMDYDNSNELRYRAEALADYYSILRYVNVNTYNKQSDSYPYFTKGYRALFFISYALDPNYHTLNDIASACNFEYCREIVKISCAMLVDSN